MAFLSINVWRACSSYDRLISLLARLLSATAQITSFPHVLSGLGASFVHSLLGPAERLLPHRGYLEDMFFFC